MKNIFSLAVSSVLFLTFQVNAEDVGLTCVDRIATTLHIKRAERTVVNTGLVVTADVFGNGCEHREHCHSRSYPYWSSNSLHDSEGSESAQHPQRGPHDTLVGNVATLAVGAGFAIGAGIYNSVKASQNRQLGKVFNLLLDAHQGGGANLDSFFKFVKRRTGKTKEEIRDRLLLADKKGSLCTSEILSGNFSYLRVLHLVNKGNI